MSNILKFFSVREVKQEMAKYLYMFDYKIQTAYGQKLLNFIITSRPYWKKKFFILFSWNILKALEVKLTDSYEVFPIE